MNDLNEMDNNLDIPDTIRAGSYMSSGGFDLPRAGSNVSGEEIE